MPSHPLFLLFILVLFFFPFLVLALVFFVRIEFLNVW